MWQETFLTGLTVQLFI